MNDTPQFKKFETHPMRIMIEDISVAGSAFASNEEGDTVFLNKRIVDRLILEGGEILMAQCIPNYEDKRHSIPWRCIRAGVLDDLPSASTPLAKPKPSIGERIKEYMSSGDDFEAGMDEFMSAGEISDALSIDVDAVQKYFDSDEGNYQILRCYRFKWI